MALAYGRKVDHPFWEWPVMRVALETAPAARSGTAGRSTTCARPSNTRLPYDIAWRKKIAVHHGGGLQQGITNRLAADTGHGRRRVYHACFTGLMAAMSEGRFDSWEADEVYDRAVHEAKGELL